MRQRTLGRSGCSVSELTLGTMTFGAETDEAGAHEQLDVFVEAGGTLVDTADVYTAGASEEILGRWYAERPAEVTDRVVLPVSGAEHEGLRNVMRLVGYSTLKEIVDETTEIIEKMCIEAALEMSGNNRAAAAELLSLSRQSLYVKLRKFGILNKEASDQT